MLSRGLSLVVLSWTLALVSSIIVALRFLARCIRLGRLEIDDYLMSLALVTDLVHASIVTVAQHYGLGTHIWNLTGADRPNAVKYTIISEGLTVASAMFGRISFAVFLIMVLGQTAFKKRCILWSIVAVQAIINVITFVQIYAQCGGHLSALWNPEEEKTAHCQSMSVQTNIAYVQSALNSFSDLLLTILPSIIVWELNLPRRAKIGLCLVLGLSVFALIASVVKITELKNLSLSNDLTYNMVSLQFCAVVEYNVVIIAASIPKLRPLYHKHVPQYFDSSPREGTENGGSPNRRPNAASIAEEGVSKLGTQYKEHKGDHVLNDASDVQEMEELGNATRTDGQAAHQNGSALSIPPDNSRNASSGRGSLMARFWRHSEISVII